MNEHALSAAMLFVLLVVFNLSYIGINTPKTTTVTSSLMISTLVILLHLLLSEVIGIQSVTAVTYATTMLIFVSSILHVALIPRSSISIESKKVSETQEQYLLRVEQELYSQFRKIQSARAKLLEENRKDILPLDSDK